MSDEKISGWCAAFCALLGFIIGCFYGCYSGNTSDEHDCAIAKQVRFNEKVYECKEVKK